MDTSSSREEAKFLIVQMVMKGMSEIPTSSVPPYLSAIIERSAHHPAVAVGSPIEYFVPLLKDKSLD